MKKTVAMMLITAVIIGTVFCGCGKKADEDAVAPLTEETTAEVATEETTEQVESTTEETTEPATESATTSKKNSTQSTSSKVQKSSSTTSAPAETPTEAPTETPTYKNPCPYQLNVLTTYQGHEGFFSNGEGGTDVEIALTKDYWGKGGVTHKVEIYIGEYDDCISKNNPTGVVHFQYFYWTES